MFHVRNEISLVMVAALLTACAPFEEVAEAPAQQALAVSLPIVRSPSGGGRFLAMRADPAGQRFYAGTDISGLMRATMPAAGTLETSDPETWSWTNYAVPGTTSTAVLYAGIATGEVHDIAAIPGTDTVFAATPDGLYRRQSPTSAWSLVLQPTEVGRSDAALSTWTASAVTSWATACATDPSLKWCDAMRREKATTDYPSSIQAVAVSRRTPITTSVVWAGVGRRISLSVGQSTNYSPYTLYRSLDSGTTWEPVLALHIDYESTDRADPTNPRTGRYRVGPTVNAIEVDPSNPRVVYVATDMGLYRTTNGLAPALDVVWSELGRNRIQNVTAGSYRVGLPRTWALPTRSEAGVIACLTPSSTAGDTLLCLPTYADELHPNVRDVAISRDASGTFVHALIESNHLATCSSSTSSEDPIFSSNVFTSTSSPSSLPSGATWTRRIVTPTAGAPQPPHQVACAPEAGTTRDSAITEYSTHYTALQARGNDIALTIYNRTSGGVVMNVGGRWQDMGASTTRHESEAQMGLWGDPARGLSAIWQTPMAWDHWVQRWDDAITAPRRALFSSDREVQIQFSDYSYTPRGTTVGHGMESLDTALSLSELGSAYVSSPDRGRDGLFWRSQGASNVQMQTPLVFFDGRYFIGTQDAGLLVTPNAGASWAKAQILQEYLLNVPRENGGYWRRTAFVGSLVRDMRSTQARLFTAMTRTREVVTSDGSTTVEPRQVLAWLEAGPGAPAGAGARYVWNSRVFNPCTAAVSNSIHQIVLDPRGAGKVMLATGCGLFAFDTSVGPGTDFDPSPSATSSVFTNITGTADENVTLMVADSSVDATGIYFKYFDSHDQPCGERLCRLHRIFRLDTTTMTSQQVIETATEPHGFTIVRHPTVAGGVRAIVGVQQSLTSAASSEPGIALRDNIDPRNSANAWLPPAITAEIALPPSPTGSMFINGAPIRSYWRPKAFAIDPADPRHVLLGFMFDTNFAGTWPTAVYESFNSGETWRVATAYDTLPSKVISAISYVDGRVYFSTAAGLVGF